MRRSISQTFSSPTPQAEVKRRSELDSELELQERERQRVLFVALQGRRPMIQPSSSSTTQTPIQTQTQSPFTYTYEPPRPRSQVEALPPSSTPNIKSELNLEKQVTDFMALQRKMSRDPARVHPMFFSDCYRKVPNGVLVGEGVGRGYVFEERKRESEEVRGML